MLHHSLEALRMTGIMAWQILWALSLGFLLSSIVESVVSKAQLSRLLPDSSPKTILKASALGAASSSCSYAATALARTLFRKGADFIAVMAFQFASTNLVVELSVLLCVLLGWQFMAAEFIGGPIMIALLVVLLRATLRPRIIEAARDHANRGLAGRMEGHAAMDMSLHEGTFLQKLTSRRGITATSHYYWMDWYGLIPDVALGLFISGILAAFVPSSFWQAFFLAGHPVLTRIWGPLIGPLVAVLSFVCSVGNVPLAAVLWNGGISFGGVISFLFADLLILPILNIYRKYYGLRVAALLAVTFYIAMAGAALIVEALFSALHLVPAHHQLAIMNAAITWNYTSALNALFLAISAALLFRFLRTGGPAMLREMGNAPANPNAAPHSCCHTEPEPAAPTHSCCHSEPEPESMHIYAATTNPGKLRDFARAAASSPSIRIEPLPALAAIPSPPEDEPTFEANARAKAIYYSLRAPNLLVLADDSGLEVAALDNAPGVRSARFAADLAVPADTDTPDNRNNATLLAALATVPESRRQARYRCVLALARNGEVLHTAEGTVEGLILTAPRGAGGFGYDPLFFLPALNRTMSELPPADRLALNHRGRALESLLRHLREAPPADSLTR